MALATRQATKRSPPNLLPRREVGVMLREFLMAHKPDEYLTMLKEALELEKEQNNV
jgi:hypothetical protein